MRSCESLVTVTVYLRSAASETGRDSFRRVWVVSSACRRSAEGAARMELELKFSGTRARRRRRVGQSGNSRTIEFSD